jgi:hypothetical protein
LHEQASQETDGQQIFHDLTVSFYHARVPNLCRRLARQNMNGVRRSEMFKPMRNDAAL